MQRLFSLLIGTNTKLPGHFWVRAFIAVVLEAIKDVQHKSAKLYRIQDVCSLVKHMSKPNKTIALSVIYKLVAPYMGYDLSSVSSLVVEFTKTGVNNVELGKAVKQGL